MASPNHQSKPCRAAATPDGVLRSDAEGAKLLSRPFTRAPRSDPVLAVGPVLDSGTVKASGAPTVRTRRSRQTRIGAVAKKMPGLENH